ncbi:hypothetical protein K432DRAFT_28508 [Lepidopterella palustris CBS 459.81]|uniref:F-box domain-containing protein n=1 Tax=Lepidopterella palustris CBS 459.81 TaxID=1314670 RepID=A0A8E2EBP2_9PEZI|nr:hypothetical protein K432DRAFT_28508 [Lepidopterella palustris CBS 459.81]
MWWSKRPRVSILDLPDELLLNIASFVRPEADGQDTIHLRTLCQVSKAFARTGQEILFEDCALRSARTAWRTFDDAKESFRKLDHFLRSIVARPDLAAKSAHIAHFNRTSLPMDTQLSSLA